LIRFLDRPKDFTFEELVKLLNGFGFYEAGTEEQVVHGYGSKKRTVPITSSSSTGRILETQ